MEAIQESINDEYIIEIQAIVLPSLQGGKLTHVTRWMKLEEIMLSEISSHKIRQILYDFCMI